MFFIFFGQKLHSQKDCNSYIHLYLPDRPEVVFFIPPSESNLKMIITKQYGDKSYLIELKDCFGKAIITEIDSAKRKIATFYYDSGIQLLHRQTSSIDEELRITTYVEDYYEGIPFKKYIYYDQSGEIINQTDLNVRIIRDKKKWCNKQN